MMQLVIVRACGGVRTWTLTGAWHHAELFGDVFVIKYPERVLT